MWIDLPCVHFVFGSDNEIMHLDAYTDARDQCESMVNPFDIDSLERNEARDLFPTLHAAMKFRFGEG